MANPYFAPIEQFEHDPDCPPFILDAIRRKQQRVRFTEDWFCQASCDALARLADETRHVSGDIIEVGSWEGRSTIALANAAHPAVVHAVDTWRGSPGEISRDLAAQRDVFATFTGNVRTATRGNVQPHRMGWRHYFLHRDPNPIRLLFIDAEHTYVEVRENIEAALPHMAPGGVICGDDAHHLPVARAVLDVFGDAELAATLWVHRVGP